MCHSALSSLRYRTHNNEEQQTLCEYTAAQRAKTCAPSRVFNLLAADNAHNIERNASCCGGSSLIGNKSNARVRETRQGRSCWYPGVTSKLSLEKYMLCWAQLGWRRECGRLLRGCDFLLTRECNTITKSYVSGVRQSLQIYSSPKPNTRIVNSSLIFTK